MKKACTTPIYLAAAQKVATECGIDINHILGGSKKKKYRIARWRLWSELAARGFSHNSIGAVAGFTHTAIGYALDRERRRRSIIRVRLRPDTRKHYNLVPVETKLLETA